jgi:cyanophycinase
VNHGTGGDVVRSRWRLCGLASLAGVVVVASSAGGQAVSSGTIILGGGNFDQAASTLRGRAVRLAGSAKAVVVVIPTAIREYGPDNAAGAEYLRTAREAFAREGATDVSVLHTRDRTVADSPAFSAPLARATLIWIDGGDTRLLDAAYSGTRFVTVLRERLASGAVIVGESAGASILGEVVVGRSRSTLVIGVTHKGFGILPALYVLPHANVMRENPALIADISRYAASNVQLLGLSIDENTSLVVRDGRIVEIIGSGAAAAIDGARLGDAREWHRLSNHERYSLGTHWK